jgi:hypothetical protein
MDELDGLIVEDNCQHLMHWVGTAHVCIRCGTETVWTEPEQKAINDLADTGSEIIADLKEENRIFAIALRQLREENARLRGGLQWYADRHHYELPDWENCSGESSNWIFPPEDIYTDLYWIVDDGGIARSVLFHGHSINPLHETEEHITIPPNAALAKQEESK